jgi:lambda family phage portal protein
LAEAKQAAKLLGLMADGDSELRGIMGATGYDAASRGRLQKDWPTTPFSGDGAVSGSLPIINARTRDAVRNSAMGRAAERGFCRHLVGGSGITSKARARDPLTGRASDALDDFNRTSDIGFARWARNPKLCDIERKKTLHGFQKGFAKDIFATGQCFCLPSTVRDEYGTHLALQWLEVEQLDQTRYVFPHRAPEENVIVGGMEIDRLGAIVAYWFHRFEHPLDGATDDAVRIPASRVLHYMDQHRARQTQAIGVMAPVLFNLWAQKQYTLYAMVRARMEQCVSVFLTGAKSQTAAMNFGLSTRSGESETNENTDKVRNLEPGMIQPLGKDVEPHFLDPKSPGANYGPFQLENKIDIAAGCGLDYGGLTRDYTKHTFNGLKVGLAETAAELDPYGYDLIDIVLRPIREEWTRLEIALGRLRAPNFLRGDAWTAAYLDTLWRLPKRISPSPQQDAAANEQNMRNYVDSPVSVIAEDGESDEDVLGQIAEFRDKVAALNLPLPAFLQPSPGRAAAAQPEEAVT